MPESLKPVSHRTRLVTRFHYGIHRLTGMSIERQRCLGMSWYDLDSNVAQVCMNKARIYSIRQGLSGFEHNLQSNFHKIVERFQVRSVTA